jgi:hypothetical protein
MHMSLGSALGVVVIIGGASCLGCFAYTVQESYTATDGMVFRSDIAKGTDQILTARTGGVPADQAMKASGAHDLPCPIDKVSVDPPGVWAASGCGWRVVYRLVGAQTVNGHLIVEGQRFVLLSRSPLTPEGDHDATTIAAGCSKDTDCKGDRVCVQGQCADPKAAPGSPAPTAR